MNFYKHHLGDYDGATAHLSWDEDMAYTRLLRAYYRREKAIPDVDKYRLVRAAGKAERKAVDAVLSEFFDLREDGWHNKRSDEEVSAYQAQADTNRRIAHDRSRQRTVNEPSTNRPPAYSASGAPNQNQIPEPLAKNQEPETRTSKPPKVKSASSGATPTAATWEAYAGAYLNRYGVEPTRNASVNGQLAQFVSRVPVADAPEIAAFYVKHNKSFYVSSRHAVGALLRDAEGLRTEWLSGRTVTETEARQADRTAAIGNVFNELIEENHRGH